MSPKPTKNYPIDSGRPMPKSSPFPSPVSQGGPDAVSEVPAPQVLDKGEYTSVKTRLRRDAAFRNRTRKQAIEMIKGQTVKENIAAGIGILEIIHEAMTERACLHFNPDDLKIWTLATKYANCKVQALIRAALVPYLAKIVREREQAGRKVAPQLRNWLVQNGIPYSEIANPKSCSGSSSESRQSLPFQPSATLLGLWNKSPALGGREYILITRADHPACGWLCGQLPTGQWEKMKNLDQHSHELFALTAIPFHPVITPEIVVGPTSQSSALDVKVFKPVPKGYADFQGIRAYEASGKKRMLLLVDQPGHSFHGWICYKHPDGQWVSLRKATPDDEAAFAKSTTTFGTLE